MQGEPVDNNRGRLIHSSAACDVTLASTPRQLHAVTALRNAVYGSKLRLPASGPSAASPGARVLATWVGHELVMTATLQSAGFAGSTRGPMELERSHRLASLGVPRVRIAELRRVAALPNQREAVLATYAALTALCRGSGIDQLIGLVEAGDDVRDPDAVFGALHRVGLTRSFQNERTLAPRRPSALYERLCAGWTDARWTQEPREPPLRPVRFAHDLGARVCGVAALHPHYPRLVIPMLARLDIVPPTQGTP